MLIVDGLLEINLENKQQTTAKQQQKKPKITVSVLKLSMMENFRHMQKYGEQYKKPQVLSLSLKNYALKANIGPLNSSPLLGYFGQVHVLWKQML